MPRLFTALELPREVADALALLRGGLPGARWVAPENYHVTLRFIGDVDLGTARDVASLLGESRARPPFAVTLDGLGSFGGDKPRALLVRVTPSPELTRLQAEQEKLARRAGLDPETRKFTPHVTLARMRGIPPGDVAAFIARTGHVKRTVFTAERFVLFSARDSVGGGPYVPEAIYPFAGGTSRDRAVEPAALVR